MILLDTYTLIGIASEPARLSPAAIGLIADTRNRLFVSSISAMEIGIAARKGRLTLAIDPRNWFSEALTRHSVEVIDITWEIAMLSVELPPHHSDPGDRIIIATAVTRKLVLLTPDRHISRYTEANVMW